MWYYHDIKRMTQGVWIHLQIACISWVQILNYTHSHTQIHTSRHTVVCRAAQETWSAWQTSVYFTGVKKIPFSYICSSTAQHSHNRNTRNFLSEFPWGVAPPIPNSAKLFPRYAPSKFILFSSYFSSPSSSSFRNTFWNHYNSHVLGWITRSNWFSKFLSAIFCHIFRLNR